MPIHRMLAVAVACAVIVIGLGVLGSVGARLAGGPPSGSGPTSVTTVRPGEGLQDVARRVVPGIAPAAVADGIRTLNRLEPGPLRPGEPLRVPDLGHGS